MRSFTKDTIFTLISNLLVFALSLATSIIIARSLGPEGKGIYSIAILLPATLFALMNMGIGPSLVYHIGQKRKEASALIGNSCIIELLIGMGAILLGFIIILNFKDLFLKGVASSYLISALFIVFPLLIFNYIRYIFLGLQKIKIYNILNILRFILFLGLILFIYMILKFDILQAIIANIASYILLIIVGFIIIKKYFNNIKFRLVKSTTNRIMNYGLKAHLANIPTFLNYRINMFIINAILNPASVGLYSVAIALGERIWVLSQAASTILFPRVSSEKNKKMLKEFTPKVSRNVFFFSILITAILFITSKWLIIFLYSQKFIPSIMPLKILMPGIIALSIGRVLANDIAGRGKPLLNSYLSFSGLIINISLNLIFIPKYKINGAALALTITYCFIFLGTLIIYLKISGNSLVKVIFLQKSDIAIYKKFLLKLRVPLIKRN